MDIRNFFGKPKKSGGGSASQKPSSTSNAKAKTTTAAAAPSKSKSAAAASKATKKAPFDDSDTDDDNDVDLKRKDEAKAINNANGNDSDSDTTVDQDKEPFQKKTISKSPTKNSNSSSSKSNKTDESSSQSPPLPKRRTSPRRSSPRNKRKSPPPPSSSSDHGDSDNDNANAKQSNKKKPTASASNKKKMAISIDSSSSSDSEDDLARGRALRRKKEKEAKKKRGEDDCSDSSAASNHDGDGDNKYNDSDDGDDSDEDFQPETKKKAATAKTKSRGRAIMEVDSDEESEEEELVIDDESEEEEEGLKKSRRASPRKRKQPARSTSPQKKKQSTSPKAKSATSTASTSAATKKKTVKKQAPPEQPAGPPKYHPPSSQLTTQIPYLSSNNHNSKLPSPLTITIATPSSIPKRLPQNNNPNFNLDTLTPSCLEGLTFVFSGILSTNEELTKRTNVMVSLGSPTKGDYYANRMVDVELPSSNTTTNNDGDENDNDNGNHELSRDTAEDLIKCLGGRVTTAVSGKTDYLICGCILEDGRHVEEGSKYKKCKELWNGWKSKWRREYDDDYSSQDEASEKKKKGAMTKAQKRDADPNTLVEVIRGIHEFYALVVYLSEWKKGTLSEERRAELEACQQELLGGDEGRGGGVVKREQQEGEGVVMDSMAKEDKVGAVAAVKSEVKEEPSSAAAAANNPYAAKAVNPYMKSSSAGGGGASTNPYAKKANPYAKSATASASGGGDGGGVSNPYAKAANPYAKKPASNPYAKSSSAAASSSAPVKSNAPTKEFDSSSLWADKYAPSNTSEILGNADSVNKLKGWLNKWERTFNDPKTKKKSGFGGPNGPWKAALLSGPPGIGKTTTATLVAHESGRDVLELNASDARSKKALSQALGDVTGSQVLSFDNMGESKGKKKVVHKKLRCIIMDEVDGMGAGDRSGMSELIQMIKKSKVPIICICNDRSSQKMRSLVAYCMDLRYRRPTKLVIARRAIEIGRRQGMNVEANAAEAMAESCGNDIRQVLNQLQMWSCKKKAGRSADMTYRDLKERQGAINKDEVLRVSMFDACKSIVEGSRGLAGADAKAVTKSLLKRTDAFFVDYMLMGLMVHQNYLKVTQGQFNNAKVHGTEEDELAVLEQIHKATDAMSDFGMCEESLRGGDQNWALLPLCSVLAVKVGHHAGGPTGGMLPGYAEFAGWLGKNSTRNKKIRLLQELRRHMNYKVSADASELRMNYLPIMREQFQELLFDKEGARVPEAIALMDEYGLDRDDVFENFDEFLFNLKELKVKKFGDLDSKTKSAFTRAYNAMAHTSQALVAEQGAEKTGRKKAGNGAAGEAAELDVVDDDKAAAESSDEDDEEDVEALKKKFLKKGRKSAGGKGKAAASKKKPAAKKTKKK